MNDLPIEEKLISIIFPLTNLRFEGSHLYEREDGSLIPILLLEINGIEIKIFQDDDYKQLVEQMEATEETTITVYLEVECSEKSIEQIIEVVNNLCSLLSFAAGTRVTWPYYQKFNHENKLTYAYHRAVFVTFYSSLMAINLANANDLKSFVESTYNVYLERKELYKLENIINTLVQTKCSKNFAELDGLNIASAVDVLRGNWAAKHGYEWIIQEEIFNSKIEELKKQLIDIAKPLFSLNSKMAKRIGSKVKELNRPAFRNVLEAMIKTCGANISNDEVEAFIKSRDMLVHQGRFSTDNSPEKLYQMYSFTDRLILAVLGYKGSFYDLQHHWSVASVNEETTEQ